MAAIDHLSFIAGAYGFAVIVVGGLTAWVMLDYRAQRRHLIDLERQGVIRRSASHDATTSSGGAGAKPASERPTAQG